MLSSSWEGEELTQKGSSEKWLGILLSVLLTELVLMRIHQTQRDLLWTLPWNRQLNNPSFSTVSARHANEQTCVWALLEIWGNFQSLSFQPCLL